VELDLDFLFPSSDLHFSIPPSSDPRPFAAVPFLASLNLIGTVSRSNFAEPCSIAFLCSSKYFPGFSSALVS